MARDPCSCPYTRLWHEPHVKGCPRANDHTPARRIKDVLARRHPMGKGEWVCWHEVFAIDTFAMRFWGGSSGQIRVGYEVKVSRGDFLAEIRRPEKRKLAMDVTHEFYFAVPPGLVAVEEVPADCGVVEVANGRSRVVRKAPRRVPRWFTEDEVRSLLRRDLFRSGRDQMARRISLLEGELILARAHRDGRVKLEREYLIGQFRRLLDKHGVDAAEEILEAVLA